MLSFNKSLGTKFLSFNDKPCMVQPTLIDFSPIKLKYYSFKKGLDECTRSCNVLSPKICVPKGAKDINVKALNMITNKNEAKAMTKHILCYCKCKFNSTCQCGSKIIISAKRL